MLVNELIRQVSDRTGLPEEVALVAVKTVLDYLKGELPEPIADHIHLDDLLVTREVPLRGESLFKGLGG